MSDDKSRLETLEEIDTDKDESWFYDFQKAVRMTILTKKAELNHSDDILNFYLQCKKAYKKAVLNKKIRF
jgi:hypothetical protein